MKVLRRVGKILLWIVVSLIALVLLIFGLLQIPAVQNWAKDRAVAFLEKKLGTEVQVEKFSLEFPKRVALEGVYFEDQKGDTLLAGERLAVDLSMWKLLQSEVEVQYVELKGIRANISRVAPDTVFNFQYIVDAFVVADTTPADTSAAPIKLAVDRVRLERVVATFHDDVTGNDAYASLGLFETRIGEIDLEKSLYEIKSIAIADLAARVRQYKPLMEAKPVAVRQAEAAAPISIQLKVGTVDLRRIAATYDNSVSALSAKLALGELMADVDTLDLQNLFFNLDKLELRNTAAQIVLGKGEGAQVVAQEAGEVAEAQALLPYKFVVDALILDSVDFKFDNNGIPRTSPGMDYAHLDARGLRLDARNLVLTPTVYDGSVKTLALREETSDFHLKQLTTDFHYDDTGAVLDNLYLETDRTLLRNRLSVAYPSIDTLAKDPGALTFDLNIVDSRVATRDVLLFAPMLAAVPPFQKAPDAVFEIALQARGSVRDILIPNLEVRGLSGTYAKLSGRIQGLPDPVRTYYDLKMQRIATNRADLDKLLPPGTIPPTVRIPETVALTGDFRGRAADFTSNVNLNTSRGSVVAKARLVNFGQRYSIQAATSGLDVGYLTKQEATVGKVTARIQADGSGFDPATASATFRAQVASARFQQYTYSNIELAGSLARGIASVKGTARDPNLAFNLDATANLRAGTFPAIQARIDLDSVNLQALGFSPTPLKIHGDIVADFQSTNPANMVGTLQITDAILFANGQRFTTDTIGIAAYNSADSGHVIDVASEAVYARLWGKYNLAEIGPAVMNVIHRYYAIPGYKPVRTFSQQWTIAARVVPSPLLFAFLPAMKGSDTIGARVEFNSDASSLTADIRSPRLQFATTVLDTVVVTAATGADALTYAVAMNSATAGTMKLFRTTLDGAVANNALDFALATRNAADETQYLLAGDLAQTPADGFLLSLAPDSLVLDGDRGWSVPAGNYIEYSPAGIVAQDFTLSNGVESLSIFSTTPVPTAPLNVQFQNFRIRTLTDFAGQDSTLADGLVNGTATATGILSKTPSLTSDLTVGNLAVFRDTLGDLTVRARSAGLSTIDAAVGLTGFGNDLAITGLYTIASSTMDLNLAIRALALSHLPALSAGSIREGGGYLRGSVDIDGPVTAPRLNGTLNFDSAFVTPTLLGSRYSIPADALYVTPQGIRFDTFTLLDTGGNSLVIDGSLLTPSFTDLRLDMDVKAENFQAVNVPRLGGDQTFYGSLNITTDLSVRGPMLTPTAQGFVRVNKGTDFKVLLPSADPEVVSREGVVRFVDRSNPGSEGIFAYTDTVTAQSASLVGMDVSATIETDTAAKFSLIIDERNGDAVTVQGSANLVGGIDPSGKVSLTGTYQLERGSYGLTLNFLKRRFTIQPGSTITWTGDPTSGLANLTAVYVANTAPYDLVEHQVAGGSSAELGRYKQKLPFQVLLKMQGELLTPEISFDIVLPEQYLNAYREVDAKLSSLRADEAELNKQVFALLLLNRFVDENPLQNDAAGGNAAERYVRNSASRILTDQLNRLAGNLISGVDLNFGINSSEDYSTGSLQNRTDLNVSLSKRLLNDRLRVSVGNNFELEGPRQSSQNASQIAGDVNIEYQLTKDGRYLVRAYRRNQYQDVVIGQAIENGATFIVTFEYDKFKAALLGTEESRKRKREEKALKKALKS